MKRKTRRKQGPFILSYRVDSAWNFVALPTDLRELREAEKWIKDNHESLVGLSEEFLLSRVIGNVKIEQITTTNVSIESGDE